MVLCFSVSAVAGLFTISSISTWYATLQKPALNPPNFIFGPVWTVLYFLMAVSLYLVWNTKVKKKQEKNLAIKVFLLQLILNFFWSFIFFSTHLLFLAFVEIIVLLGAIFWTIVLFRKISPKAALLLIPYLLWVSFAAYLTFSVWMLNS